MLDWILGGVAGLWVAWHFWSIVPVVVFISFVVLAYKRITAPVGTLQTQNYKENKKSLSMDVPTIRKIMKLVLIGSILIMGGILFAVGLWKM